VACANIGAPDGGPYDETPPKIVYTSPKFGATGTSATRIVLQFDENIKLENATENVIISPPQQEQPEIDAQGKKITIKLLDSIKPNTTYTIDFADAITDNNEGNSMGDYAFTFSSGGQIDTMQVSGYVLDASNLEPVKGMMVGVYELADSVAELHDSIFKTKALERVSRTDASGHFVIKGLKNAYYRVYALNDQNQNFTYDQKSEMLAFTPRKFIPSAQPDIKPDTVWHDSIHYDSVVYKGYTHFYPDDLTLCAFMSSALSRGLIKCERPQLEKFTVVFSAGADTLPRITGLNFSAENAFVIDATEKNDSLNYWIRDSLIYNIDTLSFQVEYFANDTTGALVLMCDTFDLPSKISKAKIDKQKQDEWEEYAKEYRKTYRAEQKAKERETSSSDDADSSETKEVVDDGPDSDGSQAEEQKSTDNKTGKKKDKKTKASKIKDEDIEIPPMPEELMEIKTNPSALDPDKNIEFVFTEPIDSVDETKLKFFTKKDSTEVTEKYILRKVENNELVYRLYAEWQPDSTYYLVCDTGLFVNIYGKRSAPQQKSLKVGGLDSYSTLFVVLQNADTSAVVQLLDGSDKVVKTIVSKDGKADFYFIKPGTYYMRMFYDHNGNGVWDTGEYDELRQPEEVFYYNKPMELKAQWEITQNFNPAEVPLTRQKPLAITKQKDSKTDKSKKSKNQQRLEDKKNQNTKSGTTSGLGNRF